MSYALDSTQTDPRLRDTDYNHFVIFDPFNVIACHDFEVHLHCLCRSPKGCASEVIASLLGSGCPLSLDACMYPTEVFLIQPAAGPHAVRQRKLNTCH